MNRSFYFIFGTGCGWLSLKLFEDITLQNWTIFIFDPMTFFAGMTCFTLAFLCLSVFFKEVINDFIYDVKDLVQWRAWSSIGMLLLSFSFLLITFGKRMIAILIFSFIYGMISVDRKRERDTSR